MKRDASGGAVVRAGACRSRVLLAVLALLASTLGGGTWSRPAQAAEADGERAARAHFRQGEAYYAAGKYSQALAEYQSGYEDQPLPGFLVNIAQCQRRMGDLARARASYGKFILVAPDSPLLPEVRSLIEELDRLIAETETAQRTPSVAAPPVPPSKADHSAETLPPAMLQAAPPAQTDSTASAASVDLTAAVVAPAQAPGDASEGGTSSRRWWLWGAGAVVVVAGITTAALLLAAPEAKVIHDGSLGSLRR